MWCIIVKEKEEALILISSSTCRLLLLFERYAWLSNAQLSQCSAMPGNLTVSINTEAMLDAKSPYISASRGLFLGAKFRIPRLQRYLTRIRRFRYFAFRYSNFSLVLILVSCVNWEKMKGRLMFFSRQRECMPVILHAWNPTQHFKMISSLRIRRIEFSDLLSCLFSSFLIKIPGIAPPKGDIYKVPMN